MNVYTTYHGNPFIVVYWNISVQSGGPTDKDQKAKIRKKIVEMFWRMERMFFLLYESSYITSDVSCDSRLGTIVLKCFCQ